MTDEMNDELRKMIEQENIFKDSARLIVTLYNGFVEYGLSENVAIEFVKFIVQHAMDKINISGDER